MDDYYKECQDKVKNSTEPVSTIDELLGISIHAQLGTALPDGK